MPHAWSCGSTDAAEGACICQDLQPCRASNGLRRPALQPRKRTLETGDITVSMLESSRAVGHVVTPVPLVASAICPDLHGLGKHTSTYKMSLEMEL